MIAALNTSFERPAVAVGQHGRLLAAACAPGWPVDLTELTVQVLSQGRQAALDGVVVATGPGRFGAVRGGIAFAKGLALARGAPLVGVPTALAVIEAAGTGDATVVLPAGRETLVRRGAGRGCRDRPRGRRRVGTNAAGGRSGRRTAGCGAGSVSVGLRAAGSAGGWRGNAGGRWCGLPSSESRKAADRPGWARGRCMRRPPLGRDDGRARASG